MKWNKNLTGPHLSIAGYTGSPLRVLAGPGTGKTYALMRRVGRLIEEGLSPSKILVCTFTRTAATDLQQELGKIGFQDAESVRSGTIHSLCFSILNRSEVLAITNRVPRPLLSFEERFLLEDLIGDDFGGVKARGGRLQAFKSAWARLQTDEPGWPTDQVDKRFHFALIAWLGFHRSMLIGELVPITLSYLKNNPACEELTKFQHVFVDEYQDLNRAEQELMTLLAQAGKFTVIGDEDQSIYSFKHAHPEGIANFHENHNGTYDESLTACRRCPQQVVGLANNLIKNNLTRTPREISVFPTNPSGEISIVQWPSGEEEANGIATFIKQRVSTGTVHAGKVLVLAPRRQLGYAIRDSLNSMDIAAHSFFHEEAFDGNPKILEDSRAQQAFTVLALLSDPEDVVALRCWCGFGSESLRSGAWARLRAHCETTGESAWNALERLESGGVAISNSSDLLARFKALKKELNELKAVRGQALVDGLFPPSQPWSEPFQALAKDLEDDFEANDLRETLRAGITQPELPLDVDYVRVMSLHKSKGLTADLVVVVGCIEGLLPSIKDGLTPAQRDKAIEEQRRLFYVAITRTTNTLVLSSVTRLPREDAHQMRVRVTGGNKTHANTITSQFITELGPRKPIATLGSSWLRTNDGKRP